MTAPRALPATPPLAQALLQRALAVYAQSDIMELPSRPTQADVLLALSATSRQARAQLLAVYAQRATTDRPSFLTRVDVPLALLDTPPLAQVPLQPVVAVCARPATME